ncbi:MAG: Phosphoenolpyruvate-protein phosphotransferase [Eubacteriales bacterium]|jgi:phosphoenolpyruvate-protein phosphotransferase (PTS system enzyme I)
MKTGISVSKGYAVGKAYVFDTEQPASFQTTADNPGVQADRLKKALKKSKEQIEEIAAGIRERLDSKNAEIIESHLNFLKDPAFIGEAFSRIERESVSAEKAVADVTQSLYDTFSGFDDDYMKERAADIQDVGTRIIRNLAGEQKEFDFRKLPAGTVLFAHDLKPSDTAQICRDNVCAIITETGGETSHTAILAKALGIPAMVGCKGILSSVQTGNTVVVDGTAGEILVNPGTDLVNQYLARIEQEKQEKEKAACAINKKIFTKEGRRILSFANIGGLKDLEIALENGAEGVGLFRTEFLFMDRSTMPTEEEQYRVYKEAAERLDGKTLTIRTLDIGGDKSLPYLKMEKESNPFLGLRAIRLCLKNPEIFETQLRAILRASVYGNIRVMFPMISCMDELQRAKSALDSCKRQLEQQGVPFDTSIKIGMMIEIPSAALLAEEFAKQVDFFSIGTNDLIQYTLAVDRMNEGISALYNPLHPAVLRLIQMTISAALQVGIPCCMCGELASDERAVPLLLQYGLNEFSVSPGVLAEIKSVLLQSINS